MIGHSNRRGSASAGLAEGLEEEFAAFLAEEDRLETVSAVEDVVNGSLGIGRAVFWPYEGQRWKEMKGVSERGEECGRPLYYGWVLTYGLILELGGRSIGKRDLVRR